MIKTIAFPSELAYNNTYKIAYAEPYLKSSIVRESMQILVEIDKTLPLLQPST
jgi:hypothetical protein